MVHEVKMPKLGMTMEEAVIVKWLKEVGEKIEKGEPLLEIMTEKVSYEVEATASGVLSEVLCKPESTVKVGEVIAIIQMDE